MLLSLQIRGEWLGGNNTKTQFRRSLSEDLRGVAASLVEQLVYEGPQMVAFIYSNALYGNDDYYI